MYGVIINQNGFVVEDCVILNENNEPENYKLQENESIVQFPTNNPITAFIKAKYDGTNWAEGATEEETAEWNEKHKPKPTPPTDTEILQEENILLKAQVNALATNQEFLEDCLIEVGQVIYA